MNIELTQDWKFCREGGSPAFVNLPHDAMLGEMREIKTQNLIQSTAA